MNDSLQELMKLKAERVCSLNELEFRLGLGDIGSDGYCVWCQNNFREEIEKTGNKVLILVAHPICNNDGRMESIKVVAELI